MSFDEITHYRNIYNIYNDSSKLNAEQFGTTSQLQHKI